MVESPSVEIGSGWPEIDVHQPPVNLTHFGAKLSCFDCHFGEISFPEMKKERFVNPT